MPSMSSVNQFIQRRRFLPVLICFAILSSGVFFGGCKKAQPEEDSVSAWEESPQSAKMNMKQVSIPLERLDNTGAIEMRGRAVIESISVGAGKRGGGLMKVLSPAIKVDGTSVEIDGEDLNILAELSAAIRSLVPLKEIQFRGLSIRGRGAKILLECPTASVDGDEKWNFHHVRLNEGAVQSSLVLKFSAQNRN